MWALNMDETREDTIPNLISLDRVIHEPARLTILAVLYVVESADFLFLLKQTGLTRGNLSSHLSKLEAAGYVHIEKMFVDKIPRTLMHLTDEGKAAFESYRTQMMNALGEL
jgi:DNA-binding MarR family transcriptional regulator